MPGFSRGCGKAQPKGKANGLEAHCRPKGSSSGIAKADFNGDGFADLAISEPSAAVLGRSRAGDVIVLRGGPNGLSATAHQFWDETRIPAAAFPRGVTAGPETDDCFGQALAAGDFNGDGYSDLAIGTPGKDIPNPSLFGANSDKAGAVFIIFGSPAGLTTDSSLAPAPKVLTLSQLDTYGTAFGYDNAYFGDSLAWGDFNADTYGDLVIGAPYANRLFFLGPKVGVVAMIPGGPAGPDPLNAEESQFVTARSLGLGDTERAYFGTTITGGDFNGDGFSDLAVSCEKCGLAQAPTFAVIYGSIVGLSLETTRGFQIFSASSVGAEVDSFFADALASGDFNGDGKADLAVGAPSADVGVTNAGAVWVLMGSASGLSLSGRQLWNQDTLGRGVQKDAGFGKSLAAGDFNADGKADLAVGVPWRSIGNVPGAGEVDVLYGSSTGLSTTAVRVPQFWTQDSVQGAGSMAAYNEFGLTLTAWNFGRNERVLLSPTLQLYLTKTPTDLAIGIPNQAVNGELSAGAVDVLYGSSLSNGLVKTNFNLWNADTTGIGGPQSHAHFGQALY